MKDIHEDIISEEEIEDIITKVHKEIVEQYINWEYKGGFCKFKVNVQNESPVNITTSDDYSKG